MKKMQFYLVLFAILIFTQPIKAFKPKNFENDFKAQQTPSISFTENKGQISDQNYNPRPDVLFGGSANGMVYHLRNNGISYQLNRVDSWKEEEDLKTKDKRKVIDQSTIYRLDVNWLGINNNFTIQTEKAIDGFNNYYLEVCPNGVNNVRSYEGVFYNNIYSDINLHYYQKNGALKYDYIIAPGADYKQIKLEIKGAENITIQNDGSLLFKTPLGTIKEGAPLVYQNGKQLPAKWIVANNVLSFSITNYDPSLELIIDPATRLWGTYYGAAGNDFGQSCTTDSIGNVYLAGITTSNTGTLIATAGSHQSANGGSQDAFLVKFNSSGTRQWGTYYGGAGDDHGYSCSVDVTGNIYLSGYTVSNTGTVIATSGSHQSTFGGVYDAFLVKFNSFGVRQWGTYYGGAGGEIGYFCTTDAIGNVYLTGITNSSAGTIIATAGAHQSTFGGGVNWDAFLVKFNSSGIRQWGTYYGGAGKNDYSYSCITDAIGNVYLAGYTASNTGTIIATAGSHQSIFGGGTNDAFLVKFNSSGTRQWGTYYGGTADDYGYSYTTDAGGNVYMAGYTGSNTGTVIATAGSHQSTYGGGTNDAYLVKFNGSGIRQWGTYYGGSGIDGSTSCTTDGFGSVYLAGYTSSNTGTIIATAGSHQSSNGGGANDAFLVKFNSGGIRQLGTYYGGAGSDLGSSCKADPFGNVYLAGYTDSNTGTGIASLGSHQSFNGGGTNDAFLVKLTTCVALNPTATSNTTLCAGASINFTANITGTTTPVYTWAGPNSFTSAMQNPSIAGASNVNIGVYTVTVNYNGCIETATTQVSTVNSTPTVIVTSSNSVICLGEMSVLEASTSVTTYSWNTGATTLSISVSPTITTTYTFNATASNGCVGFANFLVTVNALPTISVNSGSICSGNSFTILPFGANTYTIEGGSATVSPLSNATYTVVGTNTAGCVSNTFATSSVTVNTLPLPTISVTSGVICVGSSYTIVPSGASTYTYSSGSDVVSPTLNTTYSVSGTDVNGCKSSTDALSTVTVNPLPIITVNDSTICAGQSFTIVPSGASTYTYSNGSAVVTPTATSNYNVTGTSALGCVSSNTAVCTVTVNALPVVMATTPNSIICSGEMAILTVSTSATSYTWNTGATTLSISVSPTVTSTYTVNAAATNGCVAMANVIVTVNLCTGLNELVSKTITVYPNPNTGTLNITLTSALSSNSMLEIYDALGKLVVKQVLVSELNTLNVSNLNNGIYMFKILNNSEIVKTGKLIKQ